jgi:hypothetical protein
MLDQRRGRQIPVDLGAGVDSLRIKPVRGTRSVTSILPSKISRAATGRPAAAYVCARAYTQKSCHGQSGRAALFRGRLAIADAMKIGSPRSG